MPKASKQLVQLQKIVSGGLANSVPHQWKAWTDHLYTSQAFCRFCELGPTVAIQLLDSLEVEQPTVSTDWFLSPEAAIYWLAEAHEHFKGPFTDADFNRLHREIPDEPKSGRLTVRIPVWYEATVQATFERQVQLLQLQYSCELRNSLFIKKLLP